MVRMAQVQQQEVALRSDPTLLKRVKKLGAHNIDLCFNCGNCTAICPLSSDAYSSPRKMITYVQLGLEKKILESPDMWLCNYCGECSKTCPREAEPAESMMALRRLAISKYTPSPVSEKIYSSPFFVGVFMALAALFPLLLIATLSGPIELKSVRMFSFLPQVWIHNIGIALGVVIFGVTVFGLLRMYMMLSRGIPDRGTGRSQRWFNELVTTVFKESLIQNRMMKCDTSPLTKKDRLKTKWFAHMTIVWGFFGLLASTMLRFVAFPTNGQTVPITDPIRLLGTASGLLLVYGASFMIVERIRKTDVSFEHTHFTDWIFLFLLLLSGLTGFVLEVADYSAVPLLVYSALVVHLVVVFELLLMAPFSKFSHVFYRPLAIWISRVRKYI